MPGSSDFNCGQGCSDFNFGKVVKAVVTLTWGGGGKLIMAVETG